MQNRPFYIHCASRFGLDYMQYIERIKCNAYTYYKEGLIARHQKRVKDHYSDDKEDESDEDMFSDEDIHSQNDMESSDSDEEDDL